jgi:hypothetical protein
MYFSTMCVTVYSIGDSELSNSNSNSNSIMRRSLVRQRECGKVTWRRSMQNMFKKQID